MSVPSPALESLMQEHGPFLRRLARALVGDEHRADDLVQDTWLAAHTSQGEVRDRRSWLAAVMKRRLASDLRRIRPRADSEQIESRASQEATHEVVALQLERAQLLHEAVARLDEPYRSAIYLRYHEGLRPREIAARTGVPVKTVMSQLGRGTEKLRGDLDRTFGADDEGRASWFSAMGLLAFGGADVRGGSGGALAGAGAGSVSATLKVLIAAVFVSVIAAGVWALARVGATPGPGSPPAASVTAPAVLASIGQPPSEAATGLATAVMGTRDPVLAAGGAPGAALDEGEVTVVVRVTTPSGEIAVGRNLILSQFSSAGHPGDVRIGVTDVAGHARFQLPPGRAFRVSDDVGTGHAYFAETGQLIAGGTVVINLELRTPIVVSGSVVNTAGVRQPGAALYAMALDNSPPEWTQVAVADGEGRFVIAGGPDTTFQAVVPGQIPSRARRVDRLSSTDNGDRAVELVVGGPGVMLRGRVVDEAGEPVVEAAVMAGPAGRISEGNKLGRRHSPVLTWTDVEGHYTYPSALTEGEQRVAVFKSGFATASLLHTVAGGSATCNLTLERGVTVSGRVLDFDGTLSEGAAAWIGSPGSHWTDERFGPSHTARADESGRYTLHNVPSGSHVLRAETASNRPWAQGTLDLALPQAEGAANEVVIALSEGATIAGRVIDEFGTPAAGLRVTATEFIGYAYPRRIVTDAEGRFRFSCVPALEEYPENYRNWNIQVRGTTGRPAPLLASIESVEAGTVDLELTVTLPATEGATIVGRVVSATGAIPANAWLSLRADEDVDLPHDAASYPVNFDPVTGAFSHGPQAVGTYSLILRGPDVGEIARLDQIQVVDAGIVDVGDLRIGVGGTLEVTVTIELPDLVPPSMLPQLLDEQHLALDGFGRRVELERTETGWATPYPVQAGEWTLRKVRGEVMVIPPTQITIVEGENTERTVEAIFGPPQRVWVLMEPDGDWRKASLRFYNAAGSELGRVLPRRKNWLDAEGRLRFLFPLPAGVNRLDLWIDGEKAEASTTITVPTGWVPLDEVTLDGR